MSQPTATDVAIIGAGLAGLICAQQLQNHGLNVAVFDKSRGLGGRLATRRIQSAWMDHGVRYWQGQGEQTQALLDRLLKHNILQPWTSPIAQIDETGQAIPFNPALNQDSSQQDDFYISPVGLTAIAKFMAQNLAIQRSRRAISLAPMPSGQWQIQFKANPTDQEAGSVAYAKALVLAIPAPQAFPLLTPLVEQGLPSEILHQIQAVEFDPCISVMAGYRPNQPSGVAKLMGKWQALKLTEHSALSWISLEQSKTNQAAQPLLLIQSTAAFAEQYLEADDLQPAGQALLAALAELDQPGWSDPDWMQVHRWRYAFARRPLGQPWLATHTPLPLICCGDWCLGRDTEAALQSGRAAATQFATMLAGVG